MKKITGLLLLTPFVLTACVPYPVYKTLQPYARMTVLGGDGQPVSGAEVVLIASTYPYGFERSRSTVTTDADGVASFASQREWRVESTMLHGAQVFFWNWCVRTPGYRTESTSHNDAAQFESNPVVRLRAGESTPCPAPTR